MPIEHVEIPCNFVGEFKVGDNLVFNASLLCHLIQANEDGRFNKPAIIQVGSMLEAALGQIIYRAQNYNLEGVPNISEAERKEIEDKKVDTFSAIIDVLRKYHALDDLGHGIYEELHQLRKYRNKVHIQLKVEIDGVSDDEETAFSDQICAWALDVNHRVLAHLSHKFPRPGHIHGYVNALLIPRYGAEDH